MIAPPRLLLLLAGCRPPPPTRSIPTKPLVALAGALLLLLLLLLVPVVDSQSERRVRVCVCMDTPAGRPVVVSIHHVMTTGVWTTVAAVFVASARSRSL